MRAKKYAAWIHTDYTALTFDRSAELAMWEGYDAICGVSEHTSESFQNVFPELAQKVRTVENSLPRELTCKQAAMPQTDMPAGDGISLLSRWSLLRGEKLRQCAGHLPPSGGGRP